MKRKIFVASLLLSAACFAWLQNSRAEKAAPADGLEDFICDGSFFSAKIPKSWPKSEFITEGRQAKEYGVDLKGPQNNEGAYSRISLTYYGTDHRYFKTMDKYLLLNSKPDETIALKGKKYGPVRNIRVAGRNGKMFEILTFEFIPPDAIDPVKITIFEKTIAIPGKKGGFYVLTYHAPKDIAKSNLKVFEKILLGFKPNN